MADVLRSVVGGRVRVIGVAGREEARHPTRRRPFR